MPVRDLTTPLSVVTAELRFVLRDVARKVGIGNPSLFQTTTIAVTPLVRRAAFLGSHALDGALLRIWDLLDAAPNEHLMVGVDLYELNEIRFAIVGVPGRTLLVVASLDCDRLRAVASGLRDDEGAGEAPVLPDEQAEILWNNTIGYLEEPRLKRINRLGGRVRRGLLLTGPPGNGKTMACRWLYQECERRDWERTIVTPDEFRHARQTKSLDTLLDVSERGIIFFDDMDRAMLDRETARGSDDQSVFLAALDGIDVKRGVAFVFTTNCGVEVIDRAFKRPGRIDVALEFRNPDATLRRKLIDRWNPEIASNLDVARAIASTEGFSFAEIEELKNLLIMRFMDADEWDWDWAMSQFKTNRLELESARRRRVGFHSAEAQMNGHAAPAVAR